MIKSTVNRTTSKTNNSRSKTNKPKKNHISKITIKRNPKSGTFLKRKTNDKLS